MKWIMKAGVVLVSVLTISAVVQAGEITIVGTGSGVAILKAVGEAFTAANPGITVNVPPSIGSGGGIKAVGRDEHMIGRVARPIKTKEKHFGLSYEPIARMPIVFFSNDSVPVKNLTVKQVLGIYDGTITDWKDVGAPEPARIKVVTREEGDSSLSVLMKMFPGFKDIAITNKSKTAFSDPETLELAETVKGVIAFGTYGNARDHHLNIFTIDGVSPADDRYEYFGTLALIFKEKNKTGDIAEFVKFALSEKAREAIINAGGIPQ